MARPDRPYAILVFRTLQLIIPAVGTVTIASTPQAQQPIAQAYLQAMGTVRDALPSTPKQPEHYSGTTAIPGQLSAAEGEALRALRTIIFDHDPLHAFGGLRRVQAPSAELLWVCGNHHTEYDPGLPHRQLTQPPSAARGINSYQRSETIAGRSEWCTHACAAPSPYARMGRENGDCASGPACAFCADSGRTSHVPEIDHTL